MDPQNQPNQPNPVPQGTPQDSEQDQPQQPMNPQPPQPITPEQPFQPPAPASPEVSPTPVMDQPVAPQPGMAQPQSPVNPMAPGVPPVGPMVIGSAPNQPAPSNNPLGGLNKKLLILIGAGVGALILIVVIVMVIVSMLSVSKKDYALAYDYASDARSSYMQMSGLTYVSTYATETETKNNLDSFKQSQKKFSESVDLLGKSKAVQHDGKANELYVSLTKKKESFDSAIAVIAETYEYVVPAMSAFNKGVSSDLSKVLKAANAARAELEANKDKLKDANNKELANKLIPLFKKYATLIKKVQAYRDDYSKYDSKVSSDFADTSTEITSTIRDWSSNLKKTTEDADITKEFNELGKYLADKASS